MNSNKTQSTIDENSLEHLLQICNSNTNLNKYDQEFVRFILKNKNKSFKDVFTEVFKKYDKLIDRKWKYEKKLLKLELNTELQM